MPLAPAQLDDSELEAICNLLYRDGKVVVLTGAGISTSCGIPDFRSEGGLYTATFDDILSPNPLDRTSDSLLSSQPNFTGKDLFTSTILHSEHGRSCFLRFCHSLYQRVEAVSSSSATHKFIRGLQDRGRLLRCYTQNIDGLERREGLLTQYDQERCTDEFKVVQLHGDLHTIRCSVCDHTEKWTAPIADAYQKGRTVSCSSCLKRSEDRVAQGRRATTCGYLRPNIILFDEPYYENNEFQEDDLLDQFLNMVIVMGTSLKIKAFAQIVKQFTQLVQHRPNAAIIYVNRTPPPASVFQDTKVKYFELDCDEWVSKVETYHQKREQSSNSAKLGMRKGHLPVVQSRDRLWLNTFFPSRRIA